MTFAQFKQTKLFKVLKNKYLITLVVFVCLILFSPKNNIIYYFKLQKQLDELEQQKAPEERQLLRRRKNGCRFLLAVDVSLHDCAG